MTDTQRCIGVNLTWLRPGVVGGSEEYTVRLLEGAAPRMPAGMRLRLYGTAALAEAHPGLGDRYEFVEAPAARGGRVGRVVQESTWLARRSAADDVVHHAGGTVPLRTGRPSLVTIFDLQPLEHPEHFGPVKRRWLAAGLPRAAAVASLVVCLSRHTADRVRDLLGVPESRLRVVPYGRPSPPSPASTAGPRGDSALDIGRLGRFVLYPAIAYPHKRHRDLVEALARLPAQLGDVNVVLTGRAGPELRAVVEGANRLGVGDRVHVLGRVAEEDLGRLYRSAAALVFPSGYEGFGLPVVEAMSHGCPVIVSDAGPLPEVVGGAGLIHPVGDVEALADAIADVVGHPGRAAELRRLGLARAVDFDVERAATRLVDVYREVADTTRF